MNDGDKKLNILYDLFVDNKAQLKVELIDLIAKPDQIENTNKFSSLLTELNKPYFIEPLLLQISVANTDAKWLKDYLYAATTLLEECPSDNEFINPPKLLSKLEYLIFDKQGELSWKAANLLKFIESDKAEAIQLRKLEERGDFFLTYVECLLGLLKYNADKHLHFLQEIAQDDTRDDSLKEFCQSLIDEQNK